MQNFAHPGNVVTLIAPRALTSGQGFVVGKIFAIATITVASGAVIPGMVEGVIALKKATGVTPVEGGAILFDETTQEIVATGGKSIGYCVEASYNDNATLALVKLIPTAV